jgi:hypothetical protein
MPEKKTKFYSRDPDDPVQEVPFFDPASGEYEILKFKDGVAETSNPLYVDELTRRAEDPSYPVSTSPPKKKES